MKIFSAAQLKKADELTIKNQNISSTELMERAASLVSAEIHKRLQNSDIAIKIFCGVGNNGGDGLVIARHLIEKGYRVKVFVVNYSDNRSNDFLINYDRLKETTNDWPEYIKSEHDFPEIDQNDFVIDAIFGIGLNRPLEGWIAKLIDHINNSKAFILAIDMPSGLFSDRIPKKEDSLILANFTISFQTPKLVFFLPQTMDYVGDLQILDIGLDREFLSSEKGKAELISKHEARLLYKPRKSNSHKGNYGHALVVGGSYGKIGSVLLSSKAALRTGAGLVSTYIPKCGYSILQTALPEAMVITDKNDEKLTNIDHKMDPSVICFGMGAGKDPETIEAFKKLLQNTHKPMLIDADGLNMIAENKELLKFLPKKSVLTPHPKELQRLIGDWKDDFDKIEKVQDFTQSHDLVLVLKGSHTFIFGDGHMYINNSGNPGMATAGSGDVLSGIIAGLISQQYEPLAAAILGVYLHGLSGDIVAENRSYQALISGDIVENMGAAFQSLFAD
ncbi:NAD(P)H-hydrate dehydratase [Zunongwangia atlantica]|uniref:Bifunctional NAD(P)H-hydrate repair enzyme n=1 Tax=Zunongwangia atlantica 22II14-10F7 TaxID=1185767 RepID=A0A1Y1T684_9FLAO|nr:NAD(P)H-hydrate dehydratase [Zunongwangia atlantica]ORL46567.1 carbohydrate kinase [Zunongwangia atlantica 22II14-10F7]